MYTLQRDENSGIHYTLKCLQLQRLQNTELELAISRPLQNLTTPRRGLSMAPNDETVYETFVNFAVQTCPQSQRAIPRPGDETSENLSVQTYFPLLGRDLREHP